MKQQHGKKNSRKINWLTWLLVLVGVALIGTLIWKTQTRPPVDKQSSPLPAIDGIQCQSMEGAAQHTHSHLSIFNNGQPVSVPANIGVAEGLCLYWLHSHDASGEIHVESPVKRTFTLGNFFDIWGQPLTANQVLQYTDGKPLRVFVNGQPYTGDPRAIELQAHTQIALEVGPNYVAPPTFTFPPGD